ncbi:MAG: mechanosensitive ion channel family protein [Ruminococcus sp.]|nr:mechanosensitive ion channel family protein [Ruminococcus sp.]
MEKFWNMSFDLLLKVGGAVVIAVVGFFIARLIAYLVGKALAKGNVDISLINFFKRVIRIVCYIIIVISALSNIGISTTGIIASFSAVAAAFALALKDSLSDIASGVVILFTRPFKTNDFIEFDDHKGFVEKIDLMHTYIRTYDDTNVIIPNSNITTTKVNNFTTNPEIRVQVFIPISYDADFDKVKEIVVKRMRNTDKVILNNEKFTPVVRLESYQESSLEVIARCWVNFRDYWPVYYSLTENIKKDLEANDLVIPFNQLDLHIQNQT